MKQATPPKILNEADLRESPQLKGDFVVALKGAADAGKDVKLDPQFYPKLAANPAHPLEADAIPAALSLLPGGAEELPEFIRRLEGSAIQPKTNFCGYTMSAGAEDGDIIFTINDPLDFPLGYCKVDLQPKEDLAYMAYVRGGVLGDHVGGLLHRVMIGAARKYGISKVTDLPTNPAVLVWLVREGFHPEDNRGNPLPELDRDMRRLVYEGGLEEGEEKRRKYSEAQEAFNEERRLLEKTRQSLFMAKKLE
ncbi:Uncharacterised protein [uncultured archaeon]|nr:Uncharacterised protein [uncultured archaeon]